jgi:DNA repair protein RadC
MKKSKQELSSKEEPGSSEGLSLTTTKAKQELRCDGLCPAAGSLTTTKAKQELGSKDGHMHHGHRKRKRKQFLEKGIEHLAEHEPLEFLLYYALPRGDTNTLAHILINHFGSMAEVVNADYNELIKIDGVGDNIASLICYTRMFSRLYLQKQMTSELDELFSCERLKEYCKVFFLGATEEEFHCLYLTDNLKLISREKVCSGRLGEVQIPVRRIVRSILKSNCSHLVIAHNHPAGSSIPSRADVDSTKRMRNTCLELEVELVDHIIVGRDGVTSMRECGFMEFTK